MRALVLFSLVLSACVDLDKPRAFRCADDTGCVGGWVCLKDRFCHDPSIGADVACTTRADCTGGWFCGQEGRCLDPSRPAAFACDDDAQCASPWRCSSERRCVDLSREAPARAFNPATAPPRLVSPLTAPADLVRSSPHQVFEVDGGAVDGFEGLRSRGTTLERTVLYSREVEGGIAFSTQRLAIELPTPPVDFASVVGAQLVQPATGPLVLVRGREAPRFVTVPFAPTSLAPLAWQDDQGLAGSAFAAMGEGQAAIIDLDGGLTLLEPGVIDVTAADFADDAGEPVLVVLREGDGGEQVLLEPMAAGVKRVLAVDLATLAGADTRRRALQVRFERGAIGVLYADDTGFQRTYVPSLVCPELPCDGGVVLGFSCVRMPDFALPNADQVRSSCHEPDFDTDLLYDSSAGSPFDFFEARAARSSWGTSRGHVREAQGGQLSWSKALDTEVTDVLATRPDTFGERGGSLIAVVGQDFYGESLAAPVDAGSAGLSLFARLTPGVAARPVAFVEGGTGLTVLENGVVVSETGFDYPFALQVDPEPGGTVARMVSGSDGGQVLVVTTRDGLYAGVEDEGSVSLLSATLRPAPGFPINDWALRADRSGFLEGWLVANNRLFRVTASAIERWKSSEVTVTGRDPLGVWFSGDAVQLGTASGEVLALPSRVPVVPPLLDGVTGMTGLCGAVFATTIDSVWEVSPADGGLGAWRELDGPDVYRPRLHRSGQRLFVVDEDGVVLELPVSCP